MTWAVLQEQHSICVYIYIYTYINKYIYIYIYIFIYFKEYIYIQLFIYIFICLLILCSTFYVYTVFDASGRSKEPLPSFRIKEHLPGVPDSEQTALAVRQATPLARNAEDALLCEHLEDDL